MQHRNHRNNLLATTAILLALTPGVSSALPTGGSVSSGTASIVNTTPTLTTITQSTPKAVINWTGFNTAKGEEVSINDTQGSSSVTLNRISGGATTFNGSLNSNGTVFLVNPQGVLIGSSGSVLAAGFLATTSAITDSNFMAGKYAFTPGGGAATASVTNQGTISVSDSGLAALVSPNVVNSGTINFTGNVINAKAGAIALASGDTYTVDLAGDGLINLAASTAVTQQTLNNTGTLNATSAGHYGDVTITAAQASTILNNVINLGGLVEAENVNVSGDNINYSGTYIPPAPTSNFVTLTAPGNINLANGSYIGAATNNATNLNIESTATGTITAGTATITTKSGGIEIQAEDTSNNQNIQNITFNGTTIDAGGGLVRMYANGQFYAYNGSISNADNIYISGSGNSVAPTKSTFGLYLNNFNIVSQGGDIGITGYAPQTPAGNTYGADISNSKIYTPDGNVTLNGIAGPTTNGGSVGISLANDLIGAGSLSHSAGEISIAGVKSNIIGSKVINGGADGVVITGSTIGWQPNTASSNASLINIFGTGGNANYFESEGIILSNSTLQTNGLPYTYTYTPLPVFGPTTPVTVNEVSTITLNGTGGTASSTIGVDVRGGTVFDIQNQQASNGGAISITGQGGTSNKGGVDSGVSFKGNGVGDEIITNALTITGKGGSGTATTDGSGVNLSNTFIQQANSTSITGTGGSGTGSYNYGVQLAGGDLVNDYGTFKISGTGTGSSYDVETNESAASSSNTIFISPGSTSSVTGTRNSVDLKNLGYIITE